MTRRTWALVTAAATGALIAYTTLIEPRWLQLRHVRIHIRGLATPLEGLRLALLTDLHVGRGTSLGLVRRAATLVMRARPDLIALTGDLTTDNATGFEHVLGALDALHAPLGVWAVPGNHDYIVGIDAWRRQVGRHPVIRDLTNRAQLLDVGGARLCVAGVDDYYMGAPRLALPPLETRDATILLAHTPDQAERSRRAYDAVDLILSGHTHGGQIRLPLLGSPVTSAHYGELYDAGVRRRPWTQVYISRGVGTIGAPARFFARPEVSIIELTAEPRPPIAGWRARWRRAYRRIPRVHMRDAHGRRAAQGPRAVHASRAAQDAGPAAPRLHSERRTSDTPMEAPDARPDAR
ncbi:MAG: metallophosphoesterase [Longimicrobiales bacterium]